MSEKILVIDDSEEDREIISVHLQEAGFEHLIFAKNGDLGMKEIQEHQPGIVILDTNLPGANGFEICRQIKDLQDTETKVIMMTGAVDAVDAVKARKHGADDYCAKSEDCGDIIEAIKSLE